MKKLLSIIILTLSLSYPLVQADDRVTKVEIIKTSTECLVWKGQEDLLLKRNFYFNDQYLITSQICGEKDENQGWFKPDYLINSEGKYEGYPFKSFAGGKFLGGYSDHFPIYILLAQEIQ